MDKKKRDLLKFHPIREGGQTRGFARTGGREREEKKERKG